MRGSITAFLAIACLSALTQAFSLKNLQAGRPSIPKRVDSNRVEGPVIARNGATLPPLSTVYYFDQLVDHNDASKGTFQQRYWTTWEFYQKGGPIVLMTPGETDADDYYSSYLGNGSINGMIAQQENGATILIEHRFFGESNPINDQSTDSLALLTIDQAIQDLVYFAENVKLPMPGGDAVTPKQAPWVLVGGSYSGALTAWTKVASPDTFYAAYASSAVVQAIDNFWEYFQPVRENMPANCSADVEAVITHVDSVFAAGDQTAINGLLTTFGTDNGTDAASFGSILRDPLFLWQSLQPTDRNEGSFFQFCDALEIKAGVAAPTAGWGLDHALTAWGTYTKDISAKAPTPDPSATADDDSRSWYWMVCNEVGWFQDSAPVGTPTIISRALTPAFDASECTYLFPEKFSTAPTPNADATNAKYGGWKINEPRLFFANGKRDPWREATMSAETQNIPSTDLQPIAISDGYHCSDLLSFYADDTVRAVQQQGLASMKKWLAGWTASA